MPQEQPRAALSFKERQWRQRHEEILDAGYRLMAVKGFTAISVEDVANAVGISRPTFYTHFDSKEQLGAEVLVRMIRAAEQKLSDLRQTLDPADAVRDLFCWMIETQFDNQNTFDHARAVVLFGQPRVVGAVQPFAISVAEEIARAQTLGRIRPDLDPLWISKSVLSILKDPVNEIEFRNGDLDVDGLKRYVVDLFFLPEGPE